MVDQKMKPCPKCKSTNVNATCWGMWKAWCRECLFEIDSFLEEKDAIKAWNNLEPQAEIDIGRKKEVIQMAKMPTTDEWVEKIGNKVINEFVYEGRTLKEWIDLMASGKSVILPDNTTNGDVIKALFPNADYKFGKRFMHITNINSIGELSVPMDWWNALYNGGRKCR